MNTTIGNVQFPARFFAPAPKPVAPPKGVTIGKVTFPESMTKPLPPQPRRKAA